MIPAIGVMIGMYIITRIFELALKDSTNMFVKILGVVTILVTVLSIYDLLTAGISSAPGLLQ